MKIIEYCHKFFFHLLFNGNITPYQKKKGGYIMFYLNKFGYKVLLEKQVEVGKTLGGKPIINYYAKNATENRDFYLSRVEDSYGTFYFSIEIKHFQIKVSIRDCKSRYGVSITPKHNLPVEKAKKSLAKFFESIGFKTYNCDSRLSELLLESDDKKVTALYPYHFKSNGSGGYAASLSQEQLNTLFTKCYTLNSNGRKIRVKKSKAVA